MNINVILNEYIYIYMTLQNNIKHIIKCLKRNGAPKDAIHKYEKKWIMIIKQELFI
jgi:hypothetical protein